MPYGKLERVEVEDDYAVVLYGETGYCRKNIYSSSISWVPTSPEKVKGVVNSRVDNTFFGRVVKLLDMENASIICSPRGRQGLSDLTWRFNRGLDMAKSYDNFDKFIFSVKRKQVTD